MTEKKKKNLSIADPSSRKQFGGLDRRLNPGKQSQQDDDDWNKWNIAEIRQNMADDKAMLQATLKEANRLLGDQGAPPLVDIGGAVSGGSPQLDKQRKRILLSDDEDEDYDHPASPKAAGGAKRREPSAVEERPPSSHIPPPTFLTAIPTDIDMSDMSKPIGQDLEFRLRALEEILGGDRAKALRESIVQDKVIDKGKIQKLQAMLQEASLEMEKYRLQAEQESNRLNVLLSTSAQDADTYKDRLKAVEVTEKESADRIKQKEQEVKQLRADLEAANIKVRGEEVERMKILDKVKKRELEVVRLRETMEKMSQQLSRSVEEREHVQHQVKDAHSRAESLKGTLETTEEELRRKDAELRVLKRNHHLNLPEELRKFSERLREMDIERRRLLLVQDEKDAEIMKLKEKCVAVKEELVTIRAEEGSLRKRVTEAERQLARDRMHNDGERKVRDMENRRLLDKSSYYRSKLQGNEEQRLRARADQRALDNDLIAMRKRNMELMQQLHSMDEARMTAERTARESMSKCKELQEKLDLHHTVQRTDLSKLQYNSTRNTETDVESAFPIAKKTVSSRSKRSTRGSRRSGSRTSERSSSPRPATEESSKDQRRSMTADSAQGFDDGLRPGTATVEMDRAELVGRIRQLTARVESEERARIASQERVVELAEQLLEKEREKDLHRMASTGGTKSARKEGKQKLRELQSHNLVLANKLNDAQLAHEQMDFKLKEREDELRSLKKKCQELLFKVQVEEEARHRAQDQLEVTIGTGPTAPTVPRVPAAMSHTSPRM